jgi:hypothetical protein
MRHVRCCTPGQPWGFENLFRIGLVPCRAMAWLGLAWLGLAKQSSPDRFAHPRNRQRLALPASRPAASPLAIDQAEAAYRYAES